MSNREKLNNKRKSGSTIHKLLTTGVVVGAAALILTACGSDGSPKEQYLDAYKDVQDAKTLDVTHDISIESEGIDAFDVTLNMKSDNENEQYEIDVKANLEAEGMKMDFDLPIYVDGADKKVYTKAEGFSSIMGTFLSMMGMPFSLDVPEEFQGKIIALDSDDFGVDLGELDDVSNEQELEFSTEYYDFLNSFDEAEFKDEDGIITLMVDGEKFKNTLVGILNESGLSADELGVSSDDLLDDQTEIDDVKITALVEKGNLTGEKFRISMTSVVGGEETVTNIEILNEYNEINGKVDFTFDLKEENIITVEDLMGDVFGAPTNFMDEE